MCRSPRSPLWSPGEFFSPERQDISRCNSHGGRYPNKIPYRHPRIVLEYTLIICTFRDTYQQERKNVKKMSLVLTVCKAVIYAYNSCLFRIGSFFLEFEKPQKVTNTKSISVNILKLRYLEIEKKIINIQILVTQQLRIVSLVEHFVFICS